MKIGLTVPILNNFRMAVEMLHSAKTKDHELLVDIQDQFRTQRPLSAAWNRGAINLFAKGCDYVVVVNDDVLFAPGCIDAMVAESVRLRPDRVILVSANNILGELTANPSAILDYPTPTEKGQIADHPNYSCFMIPADFFRLVGEFDENFDPAWFEDNDSHRRIELVGCRAVCTTAAPSIHFGGVSTSLMDNPNSAQSREYYQKKWGGVPGHEKFATPYNDPNLTPNQWKEHYAG